MKLDISFNKNREQANLSGELTIYSVKDLHGNILDSLDNASKLEMNCSKVTKCDTAGFQLLLLTSRVCRDKGIPFSVIPSSEVSELFKLYGEAVPQGEVHE